MEFRRRVRGRGIGEEDNWGAVELGECPLSLWAVALLRGVDRSEGGKAVCAIPLEDGKGWGWDSPGQGRTEAWSDEKGGSGGYKGKGRQEQE